eukprot:1136703-Pelagomonas_calceolata.AAC.4
MAECAPCKLLLPFNAYLLPLDNQQQTIHQRFPHPHTRAGRAACWQAGMVCRWTAKSPERAPPDPGPRKVIHESMLMKFGSTGAASGA